MKLRFLYIALLLSAFSFAQKKEKDTLKTKVINVVKPFDPSVSDAFKIQKNPHLETEQTVKSPHFEYKIFSVPVASTFVPKRGTFVGLKRPKLKQIYNNFISAGYGNNNTPLLEAFIHDAPTKSSDIGVFINVKSSDGNVKNSLLDDSYSDVKVDAFYKKSENNFDWQLNTGLRSQKSNWYGISPLGNNYVNTINPKQDYNNFYIGGALSYFNSYFEGGTFEYSFFSDDYKTTENYLYAAPQFAFPLSSEYLTTTFSLAYLDGTFNKSYLDANPVSYQFFNLGVAPNLEVLRDNFSFNLGVKVYYSSPTALEQNSRFFAYPNVTVSYKSGLSTIFGGLTGDLHQNTYKDFVNANPFVSPTLNIKRTDEQYKVFLGFKGTQQNISYELQMSYKNEKDKALFILNPVKILSVTNRAYEFGNSFNVVYDNVKTLSFTANAEVAYNKSLTFGSRLNIDSYTLSNEEEAWNLPSLRAEIYGKYAYKKWEAQARVYVVGERKGLPTNLFPSLVPVVFNPVTNAAYVDANLSGGYLFSDRLTAFVKFNNILGVDYQKYTNFTVQGFQALAGITYKFDL